MILKYTYTNTPGFGTELEYKQGFGFGFGVLGFIGAEYFILPKLCIGGEFDWGLVLNSTAAGTYKSQGMADQKTAKSSNFSFDANPLLNRALLVIFMLCSTSKIDIVGI